MDSDNNFVGDDDHAKQQEPLDYRLRAATKRTDLPDDVIRLLSDAYYEVWLGKERVRVLQDKNDSLLSTNEELEARIKNLKEGFEGGCHLCEVVAENSNRVRDSYNAAWAFNEELEKKNAELLGNTEELIRERDEARRDACNNHALVMDESDFEKTALRYAEENGWSCFQNGWSCKENNND
jgi:hypothetical protein